MRAVPNTVCLPNGSPGTPRIRRWGVHPLIQCLPHLVLDWQALEQRPLQAHHRTQGGKKGPLRIRRCREPLSPQRLPPLVLEFDKRCGNNATMDSVVPLLCEPQPHNRRSSCAPAHSPFTKQTGTFCIRDSQTAKARSEANRTSEFHSRNTKNAILGEGPPLLLLPAPDLPCLLAPRPTFLVSPSRWLWPRT